MTHPRPIADSYWVKPGQFLAGEYPGNYEEEVARRRLLAFLEAGITDFIDLTHPHELTPYEAILRDLAYLHDIQASYMRISIRDFSVPSKATMQSILTRLDESLDQGRKVYLHCWGGVGRTGTVVGCYLVQHGMSGDQALNQIAEWWQDVPKRVYHPRSPETAVQVEYVRRWALKLGGENQSTPSVP